MKDSDILIQHVESLRSGDKPALKKTPSLVSPLCPDSSPGLGVRDFSCFSPASPRIGGTIGRALRLVVVPLVQVVARQHAGSAWYSAKIQVTIDGLLFLSVT